MTTKQQIDRLFKEWNQHGKIIIGVDYDDTISPCKLVDEEDCKDVMERLKQARYTGAYIVINTACAEDRFDEIKRYCSGHGLIIDSINKNPIHLPYGNHGKIQANIYIDDRAGLNEALMILEKATYMIRGSKEAEAIKQMGDVA